jgi:hypothetical protein
VSSASVLLFITIRFWFSTFNLHASRNSLSSLPKSKQVSEGIVEVKQVETTYGIEEKRFESYERGVVS